jgi:polyisoprenoid-binding protein YceI
MKLPINLVEKKTGILAVVVMLAVISPLAFADGGTWSLDPRTSSARLFQGSTANTDSVNTGVARVTGDVRLDTNDLNNSVFYLSIYPADENWGHALESKGGLPAGYVPDATDLSLMTFKSKQILRTGNGKLKVFGELTLTHVERNVVAEANEAYAGPVYSDPVIHTETREVTFLLKKDAQGLSASAPIIHEDFPELLRAIRDTNWPSVVQNEVCQAAYEGGGEGYSGPACTGTLIAATHANNSEAAYEGGGEGYNGPVNMPPAGEQTTIVLDLRMVHTSADGAVAMLLGNPATR